jgi:ATP-dependent Clp protease adaptor protein ClpS
MTQLDTARKVNVRNSQQLREPSLFKLIYMNDDTTTMEFVVESLTEHFDYSHSTALEITETIHQEGSAVVAVLPYEVAEQKGIEITMSARSLGYPLQIKLEPD